MRLLTASGPSGLLAGMCLDADTSAPAKNASRKNFYQNRRRRRNFYPQPVTEPQKNTPVYDQHASEPTIYAYVGGNPVNNTDSTGLCSYGDVSCHIAMCRSLGGAWCHSDTREEQVGSCETIYTTPCKLILEAPIFDTTPLGWAAYAACDTSVSIVCHVMTPKATPASTPPKSPPQPTAPKPPQPPISTPSTPSVVLPTPRPSCQGNTS